MRSPFLLQMTVQKAIANCSVNSKIPSFVRQNKIGLYYSLASAMSESLSFVSSNHPYFVSKRQFATIPTANS